jgi:hypothetical protein
MPASYVLTGSTATMTPQMSNAMKVCAAIALYNTTELTALIFVTFKRRSGLYFWSLLLSTLGIIPYVVGLLLKLYSLIPDRLVYVAVALLAVGWQLLVTGQSVVMYSRLHLLAGERVRKWVLGMIVVNWLISNVPTTVLAFGAISATPGPYLLPYTIWERLQLCLYFVQEIVLSGLYVYYIIALLRLSDRREDVENTLTTNSVSEEGVKVRETSRISEWWERTSERITGQMWTQDARTVFKHLLAVNLLLVLMDITMLIVEFVGYFEVQVLYKVGTYILEHNLRANVPKAALYSIKLKLEFWILNKLTTVSSHSQRRSQLQFSVNNTFPYTNPAEFARSANRHTEDISPTTLLPPLAPWHELHEGMIVEREGIVLGLPVQARRKDSSGMPERKIAR